MSKSRILQIAAGTLGLILTVSLLNRPSHTASEERIAEEVKEQLRKPATIPQLEIKTSNEVDENLFILRLLEETLDAWPSADDAEDARQAALATIRTRLSRYSSEISHKKLDPELTSMCEEIRNFVDEYQAVIRAVERVKSDANMRVEKESFDSGYKGGFAGGSAGTEMYLNGADGGDAIAAGLLTAGITYLVDDYFKSKERESAKQREIQDATAPFVKKVEAYQARWMNVARNLERKYSWQLGEAGFEEGRKERDLLAEFRKNGDSAGVARVYAGIAMRRPRDPFAVVRQFYSESCLNNASVAGLVKLAEACVGAASLVPEGEVFNEHRLLCLVAAGDIAARAATKEIGRDAWGTACNSNAGFATGIWNLALAFSAGDPDGEIRERRCWSLMQSGHLQEAMSAAAEVFPLRKNTLRFARNYPCLLSFSGNTKDALAWVTNLIANFGFNDITGLRNDADLAQMRKLEKKEFEELVAVRWSWNIQYGIFNDDILVTNSSKFAIDNVSVSGTLHARGRTFPVNLKAEQIKSGETFKWVNVVSIPGSQIDSNSVLNISCNQSIR